MVGSRRDQRRDGRGDGLRPGRRYRHQPERSDRRPGEVPTRSGSMSHARRASSAPSAPNRTTAPAPALPRSSWRSGSKRFIARCPTGPNTGSGGVRRRRLPRLHIPRGRRPLTERAHRVPSTPLPSGIVVDVRPPMALSGPVGLPPRLGPRTGAWLMLDLVTGIVVLWSDRRCLRGRTSRRRLRGHNNHRRRRPTRCRFGREH